jgi:hypothetical protein
MKRINPASDGIFSFVKWIDGIFICSAPCFAENACRRRLEIPDEYEYDQSIQSDHKSCTGKTDPARSLGLEMKAYPT